MAKKDMKRLLVTLLTLFLILNVGVVYILQMKIKIEMKKILLLLQME
ncbi:hypothetical protein [Anaerofustis butyriciformans]|nr:hypothetical protein [Anaerofustis sp. HA2171]